MTRTVINVDSSAVKDVNIDGALVRAQLAKVLASHCFASAQRLRQFLRYVVEETLAGRSQEIKEFAVGISVYGKAENYDPKADATVRGEASRLRGRLAEYYRTEGIDDSLEIRLEKGSYVPRFQRRSRSTRTLRIRSVAVLPFRPLSRSEMDGDTEALGLALADALITRLGLASDLIVRPTAAVSPFLNSRTETLDAAHKLQTDAVTEGHFQVDEKHIRISIQLLDSASGRQLWREQYEGTFDEIFALQATIAEQLACAVRGSLVQPQVSAERVEGPSSRKAYSHFARGRHHLLRYTPQSCAIAADEFTHALASNAYFPLADAYIALTYIQQADLLQTTYSSMAAPVRMHIERALAADPGLPEGIAALGTYRFRCLWDWDAAEQSFQHALTFHPNSIHVCLDYAALLACLGRFDEASGQIRRALELDPASPLVHVCMALNHWFRREYQDSFEWTEAALRLDPHFVLAHAHRAAYFYKARSYDRWADSLLHAFRIWHLDSDWVVAHRLGDGKVKPKEFLDALVDRELAAFSTGAAWFAFHYAELGDTESAFDCLYGAYEQRSGPLVFLNVDPAWDSLRGDPRFQSLLTRMRLTEIQAG